jgi:HK97 family phage prohead protease
MSDVDVSLDATRNEVVPMKRAELANIREVRQYGISDIEVREQTDSDTVTFSGYATVFNHDYEVYDAFGKFTERLAPGAFTRTLTEAPDVMLLVNHQGLPLARTKSGTLSLTQDKVGLRVQADLDANDPDVQAVLPKMRRGDVDEMSFAFRVNDQVWSDDFTDRTITEVNLSRGDVSIVSFGANPATVAALRAALADEDVRAQLFADLDERVLTTADLDEPADVEPVEAAVEVEVVELVDADVDADIEDESEQRGSAQPVSYYLSQLVDRRMPA